MNEEELIKFSNRLNQIADELMEYSEGLIILIAPARYLGGDDSVDHGLVASMRGSTFVRRGLIEKAANECLDIVAGPGGRGEEIEIEDISNIIDEDEED